MQLTLVHVILALANHVIADPSFFKALMLSGAAMHSTSNMHAIHCCLLWRRCNLCSATSCLPCAAFFACVLTLFALSLTLFPAVNCHRIYSLLSLQKCRPCLDGHQNDNGVWLCSKKLIGNATGACHMRSHVWHWTFLNSSKPLYVVHAGRHTPIALSRHGCGLQPVVAADFGKGPAPSALTTGIGFALNG